MKKWMMPIGLIVAICILAASVAMPICLADQNRIEIEGEVNFIENASTVDEYKKGQLQKGDEIKVVVSDMRGDGNLKVLLANTPRAGQETCLNRVYYCCTMSNPLCTICRLPCIYYDLICPKPTLPTIEKTTITHEGDEKIFTVPEDGVYYLDMETEKGNVIYGGYIEIIKT